MFIPCLAWLTLAITGVQKQSEAPLLHVRVDGVVRRLVVFAVRSHVAIARLRYVTIAINSIHAAAMTAGNNTVVTE